MLKIFKVKTVEKALEFENDLLKLVDELSKEIENIQVCFSIILINYFLLY